MTPFSVQYNIMQLIFLVMGNFGLFYLLIWEFVGRINIRFMCLKSSINKRRSIGCSWRDITKKKDKKLKQIQISKRIEFNKKLSKAASQNGEPMDNLAKESEMAENVAYEQASDKRNVTDYNFTHKPKKEG